MAKLKDYLSSIRKALVQSSLLHKSDSLVHSCNPNTGKRQNQQDHP